MNFYGHLDIPRKSVAFLAAEECGLNCLHVTSFYPPAKSSGMTVASLAGEKLCRVKVN